LSAGSKFSETSEVAGIFIGNNRNHKRKSQKGGDYQFPVASGYEAISRIAHPALLPSTRITRGRNPSLGLKSLTRSRGIQTETHLALRPAIRSFLSMEHSGRQRTCGLETWKVIGSPQQWEFAGMAGSRWNFGGLWR
jgi:hypothetical protein